MKRANPWIVILLMASLSSPQALIGAEAVQKIRIGLPSLALTYMPFYVAQEKGILKKVGLEAEYIQMNTGIQPQAVINGNINFFPSLATGISAAVAGLPLVAVLNFYTITPWMLVTSKIINKPQDLIGKKIAISGIRNTGHYLLMAWFKKVEINDKDVGFIMTGGTASSFASLASEQVVGAVLTPPFDDKAVSRGFKKFILLGDLADIPTSGLITSRAEITNHRDRVQKTIAAALDAITWIRNNREESVTMIADKFKITPAEANGTYETFLSTLNKDGRLPLKVLRGYLDILRQERPLPADLDPQKFIDFSMLPAAK
ncbi:MAG TPA: ABC transporter substrate-binding protein [Acidobacteriota bacterium]|nr:ABC transporter substrate-binding protein [Acidobacteriota bacterium]